MKRFFTILFLALALIAISCGGLKGKLIGKWISDDQVTSVEFFRDGTIVFSAFGMNVAGTYSVLDEKKIKIDLSSPIALFSGTQIVKATTQKKTLVLVFDNGVVLKMNRIS
ncbi:hypothetical protein K8I28_02355 [bacterium]|nr:hypothetical protein [bacterium]